MLERLGMIGVSWRDRGAEALADFALEGEDFHERLAAFRDRLGLSEVAYLSTCNRVELVFLRSPDTPAGDLRPYAFELLAGSWPAAGEAERRLKAWSGEGVAEHLFLVTAALDSACLGETEIGGQVRCCHELAREQGLSGPTLELLFDEAFRVAARVRGETNINSGRVSLAEIAVDLIKDRLDGAHGPVALVGVSPMTERAAVSLSDAGIPLIIVNRSLPKAEALATLHGGTALSLSQFVAAPPPVEALLCATGSPQAVLPAATIECLADAAASGRPPLVVDMAVPPDVDPEDCRSFDVPRTGMNEIASIAEGNRSRRATQAAAAREIVDDALVSLNEKLVERAYGPVIRVLQQRYQRTASEGLKRLLKKELRGLGDEERNAITRWSEVLARRFAHIPCLGLRGLMREGPEGSIDAFIDGLDQEFADELRASLHVTASSPQV